ncbi:hypothetical protein RRG08_025000 [Elysia crispata]|uniref:Uncharacterized protein n=1 Tax=Elysia crispata TaxID=231223 RepID=A0AAE1E1R2_9GAST|nr:hypothetical protein RRG08_025000 [Elysia crispata]
MVSIQKGNNGDKSKIYHRRLVLRRQFISFPTTESLVVGQKDGHSPISKPHSQLFHFRNRLDLKGKWDYCRVDLASHGDQTVVQIWRKMTETHNY